MMPILRPMPPMIMPQEPQIDIPSLINSMKQENAAANQIWMENKIKSLRPSNRDFYLRKIGLLNDQVTTKSEWFRTARMIDIYLMEHEKYFQKDPGIKDLMQVLKFYKDTELIFDYKIRKFKLSLKVTM